VYTSLGEEKGRKKRERYVRERNKEIELMGVKLTFEKSELYIKME